MGVLCTGGAYLDSFVHWWSFVQEMLASKSPNIQFLSTKDQVADVFTKPLSSSRFSILRDKLIVFSPHLSLRGRIRDKSQDSNSNSFCNNN